MEGGGRGGETRGSNNTQTDRRTALETRQMSSGLEDEKQELIYEQGDVHGEVRDMGWQSWGD